MKRGLGRIVSNVGGKIVRKGGSFNAQLQLDDLSKVLVGELMDPFSGDIVTVIL